MDTSIFKAYDIRGIYPEQINETMVYKIAQAYVKFVNPKKVILGRDVRESGSVLWQAAADGLTAAGVDVIDIGIVSTDMMYFAVVHLQTDGGITVSASHNPREYNGLKMVRSGAVPISGDSGIADIEQMVKDNLVMQSEIKGIITQVDITNDYIDHCLSFIDISTIKPMELVANANFGMAGKVFEKLVAKANLPLEIIPLNFEPDGNFPKGRPDPLIPENRSEIEQIMQHNPVDLGVAWDADADRIFFFDENAKFIDGYYIVALLSTILLVDNPGATVIIDPRMVFATRTAITSAGGRPLVNKVGHTFMKERMRAENAVFAGENSAHLYFRDNYFCDNGIIPVLLILQELSKQNKTMSELVLPWTSKVFVTGEENFKVHNTSEVIDAIRQAFVGGKSDEIDGLSLEFVDYRFNVRPSNTEPLLRLNMEAYSPDILAKQKAKIVEIIKPFLV